MLVSEACKLLRNAYYSSGFFLDQIFLRLVIINTLFVIKLPPVTYRFIRNNSIIVSVIVFRGRSDWKLSQGRTIFH
jgi:hypothetical protein